MKKLFLFAAAALALTACTSEDDLTLSTAQKQPTADVVGFDVFMPQVSNVTRAGDPAGVMTTDKLKTAGKGFGVFAFHQNNVVYSSTLTPNFMFNEQVHWSSGWTYSPLKYWPNETDEDSQTDNGAATSQSRTDRLSFFAYAPYVSTGEGATLPTKNSSVMSLDKGSTHISGYSNALETSGITAISAEDYAADPKVAWTLSTDLDNNVDLLWGVAPAGMTYTSVNPAININKAVGLPLLDMVKPDKDQKMKFQFQHALSRIGLSVVSAIDQIAAGDDGGKFNKDQTRILIDEVTVWGDFGKEGVLNLNNTTANVANWIEASVDRTPSTEVAPQFTINATNGYLSPDLRYDSDDITAVGTNHNNFAALKTGVLPSEQSLMVGGPDPSRKVAEATPAYEYGTVLYKKENDPSKDYVIATVDSEDPGTNGAFTKDASNNYTQASAASTSVKLDGTTQYYKLTISGEKTATGGDVIAVNAVYYTRTGNTGEYVYTYHKNETGSPIDDGGIKYFTIDNEAVLSASGSYASGTYYRGLLPRYFMTIPSALTPETPTTINVKIKYHVVTKDTKLTGNVSDVENEITKTTKIQLRNGKSYNLKLILGLTSVKLDASVADWQIADDTEVWLPKNNE